MPRWVALLPLFMFTLQMGLCHGRPWEPPKSSFVVPSMELTQTTDRTCIDFKVTTVCWEESNPGTWKIDPASGQISITQLHVL